MFGWFSRRRTAPARPRRRLPKRELAPVEEIVEQGLLVADVAVRMGVKNEIILNALGRKADYDEQQIIELVRTTLHDLVEERERDARHIARMREEIRSTGRSSWSENDYSNDDSSTLRHRQEVYEQVAVQLREREADDEYLTKTAERARAAAWHEIGDSLKEKASHPYYAGGSSEEYKRNREARIELLIQRDLTDLMQQRGDTGAKSESAARNERSGTKRLLSTLRPGRAGDASPDTPR